MSRIRSDLAVLALVVAPAFTMTAFLPACKRSPASPSAPTGRVTAGLGHTLSPPASFVLLTGNGKTFTYTIEGKPAGPDDPKIILTRTSKVFLPDENVRRIAAETFLSSLPEIKNAANFTTASVTIDGLHGYETVAFSNKTGTKLRAFCTTLFAADGSYYVVGLAATDTDLTQAFKAAAASLKVQ